MYRFLFKHKIGICPFPIEENDSDEIYSKMKNLLKEANDRITQQKNDFYFKSKSPEKVKYAESDTIKKNELVKCDSAILENGKFLYLDNESEVRKKSLTNLQWVIQPEIISGSFIKVIENLKTLTKKQKSRKILDLLISSSAKNKTSCLEQVQ